jgi:O-acetylhomoserine (thiol)-lyase
MHLGFGAALGGEVFAAFEERGGELGVVQRAVSGEKRDMGATISPFAAFQILQGLETLPVCMEQHNANAIAVANYLAGHSKVEKVYFPGLQTGKHRRRADAYLLGGYGALVGFELKDGAEAASVSLTRSN